MTASTPDSKHSRLADRILVALQLAVEQKDTEISTLLCRGLEMAMTRNAGGPNFVERRSFSAELNDTLAALEVLKNETKS